jgi:hypothetical protein
MLLFLFSFGHVTNEYIYADMHETMSTIVMVWDLGWLDQEWKMSKSITWTSRYRRDNAFMHLFDNVLLIDLTWRYITLIYLTLFDDFDVITTYTRGSAVLTCLYKHLWHACYMHAWRGPNRSGQYLIFLQVWIGK